MLLNYLTNKNNYKELQSYIKQNNIQIGGVINNLCRYNIAKDFNFFFEKNFDDCVNSSDCKIPKDFTNGILLGYYNDDDGIKNRYKNALKNALKNNGITTFEEKDDIIIDRDGFTWIYLADKSDITEDELKEAELKEAELKEAELKEAELKKLNMIGLYGPISELKYEFLMVNNNIVNVNFSGLNKLETIKDRFIYYCNKLENVDFSGLSNLKTINGDFITNCNNLKNVDFSGLSNLETIDGAFISECKNLKNVDFLGLRNLETINGNFITICNNLQNVEFSGLEKLSTINGDFMLYCKKLIIDENDAALQKLLDINTKTLNANTIKTCIQS